MADYREDRFRAQDGLSLYYRDYGTERAGQIPILCLAGLSRNAKDFAGPAEWLAGKGHRVIVPDYRGRGQSDYDPNPQNYQPTVYLNDIRHLMAALGLHHVVVIGSSMGGLLGMAMGVAMPTAIRGLVLNDIGPELEPAAYDKIKAYLRQAPVYTDWEAATRAIKTMFTDHKVDDSVWLEIAKATFKEQADGRLRFDWDPNIMKPIDENPEIPDLMPYFRSIFPVPTLALRGEHSGLLTEDGLARMAAQHPDLTATTIPNAGHTPTLNEPASREAIDAFLARFRG